MDPSRPDGGKEGRALCGTSAGSPKPVGAPCSADGALGSAETPLGLTTPESRGPFPWQLQKCHSGHVILSSSTIYFLCEHVGGGCGIFSPLKCKNADLFP